MGERKLTLHVGSHKTGTTSIQAALTENRQQLLQEGILYPDISPIFPFSKEAHHGLAHEMARDDANSAKNVKECIALIKKQAEKHNASIVLSSEAFYRHELVGKSIGSNDELSDREAYVARMAALFQDFDVGILLYLRHPISFAESLYATKLTNSIYADDFETMLSRKPFRLNYDYQIGLFEKYFPQVKIIDFETEVSKGLLSGFFQNIGSKAPIEVDKLYRPSPNKAALAWILEAKGQKSIKLSEVRTMALFATSGDNEGLFDSDARIPTWKTQQQLDEFYEEFCKSSNAGNYEKMTRSFSYPLWTPEEHNAANNAFKQWQLKHKEKLALRKKNKVPHYVPLNTQSYASEQLDRNGKLRAAVCVLTRQRPKMLTQTLESFTALDAPVNSDVSIIVVENDTTSSISEIIETFANEMPFKILHILETKPGIPAARNRAVAEAIKDNADVILFIDDDEAVAKDWLSAILERYRNCELKLIGGPVIALYEKAPKGFLKTIIWQGVRDRFKRRASRAEKLWSKGRENEITVVTNNWLADKSIFTEHDIWFDETLIKSGGSDTDFFYRCLDNGIKTGWAPDAIVYETNPDSRLTPSYVFWRACHQRRASVDRKIRSRGFRKFAVKSIPEVIYRLAIILLGPILVILSGGKFLTRYIRSVGTLYGLISGIMGARSTLYVEITGS